MPKIIGMLKTMELAREKKTLIAKATNLYGHIKPCTGRTFHECFSVEGGMLTFWFNDLDGNTHHIVDGILS